MRINDDQLILSDWKDNLRFHYIRSKGHLFRYLVNRYRWYKFPQKRIVTDYPEHVDIELSSKCNMHCSMCYTSTELFNKRVKKDFLDFDLYKHIVDECATGGVFSIRLSWRGEPSIHKNFVEAVRYAKKKKIREVSTLTNGLAFTPEMFEELVMNQLDWITISADGTDEIYEKIRKPAKFSELILKLKEFKQIKKKYKSLKPVIKVQTIWPAIESEPKKYFKVFSHLSDQIACNQLLDYLYRDENVITDPNFECPVLYQRLTVGANGKVFLCYCDELEHHVLGDLRNDSIKDIWHGEKMASARNAHRKHVALEEYDSCKKCFHPRILIPEKNFEVENGRKIRVDKLEGRRQIVGQ